MPTVADIAFNSWMAPVRAEIQQQDLAIKKQEVVANQLALQNQVQLNQDMQSIWGGEAPDATSPNFMPKLLASAQSMAAHGNPQGAASMLSSLSMLNYRQAEIGKIAQQTEWKQLQQIGATLGAVTDDASETAALAQLPPEVVARLNLTGSYAVDAPKIKQVAMASMTRAQQLAAEDRKRRLDQQISYQDAQLGLGRQRLNQAEGRLGLAAQQLSLRQQEFGYRQQEDARKDARAQEGLALRERMTDNRSLGAAGRLQPLEAKAAENIFAASPLTASMPDNIRKAYASVAAARAKQAIRRQMIENGDAEYLPQDFDDALMSEMETMARDGLFNPETSGGFFSDSTYSFKGKPQAAPAPKATPAPKAEANVMKKMQDDPKVQAILGDSTLSQQQKVDKIHALGYK